MGFSGLGRRLLANFGQKASSSHKVQNAMRSLEQQERFICDTNLAVYLQEPRVKIFQPPVQGFLFSTGVGERMAEAIAHLQFTITAGELKT